MGAACLTLKNNDQSQLGEDEELISTQVSFSGAIS